MNDINQERKRAVREAWKSERTYVRDGKGTRDWSQAEQREIVAKGRANGYEGHHMKSVKDYPQYAGDSSNIQFLNRSEHINGAHRGDPQNSTNGYYNHKTETMHRFKSHAPEAPATQELSSPLSQRQQNIAIKREQVRSEAAKQAKNEQRQNTSPKDTQSEQSTSNAGIESMRRQSETMRSNSTSPSANKGIESARQKSNENQSKSENDKSTNKGIANYKDKASGKSSNVSNNKASSKGASVSSGGKSNSGSSGGQSSGM